MRMRRWGAGGGAAYAIGARRLGSSGGHDRALQQLRMDEHDDERQRQAADDAAREKNHGARQPLQFHCAPRE